ncbi:hypothetical protein FB451DRAFT_12895 [Mycena latifolia]|nr:hypothetical protein FB451DRAFT_12895 [Mycena latifolia]
MDPTTKFQLALPYALLPVSPGLSALHSVRVQAASNSCPQCGCALHRGESSVRAIRSKPLNSRAIQTTCLVCGWVQTLPAARGNAALFPRTRRRGAQSRVESNVIREATVVLDEKKPLGMQQVASPVKATPTNPQQASPAVKSTTLPKPRPKKKGGLQSMLERNKERESREKQSGNGTGGGLAMFLNNL